MLANGSYTLRLTATDDAGNTSTLTRIVNVAGELKLGDFRMTFTDLTIPAMGIPLTVLRTYDSLIADQQGDFGFGWRFEFGKVNLRTSLPSPETAFTGGGRLPAFQDGTRIVLTPPGNRPIGFTFRVREETLLGVVRYYHPVFVPDPGVTAQLSVPLETEVRAGLNWDDLAPLEALALAG